MFASILDRRLGGHFTIQPTAPFRTRRRYLDDTAVLETTFSTAGGTLRLTDFMAIDGVGTLWNVALRPHRELVRVIECIDGVVELAARIEPRPDYGRTAVQAVLRPHFGWVFEVSGAVLTLATDVPLAPEDDGARLAGRDTLRAGDTRSFGLGFDAHEIAVRPAAGPLARRALDATTRWWRGWVGQCTYEGANRDLLVRSAITLKLLTYALSGAVIAAPTTSLPESLGAGRNYDYRFCWLRDAAITMRAFLDLGFRGEADAFLHWMLSATRLTRPALRILYDVHGRNDAPEQELDHLSGFRGSKPVRIGNAAADQLQLDTYGAVVLASYDYICLTGPLPREEMRLLRDFGEVVCRRWEEPDHGLRRHVRVASSLHLVVRGAGRRGARRIPDRGAAPCSARSPAHGIDRRPAARRTSIGAAWLPRSALRPANAGHHDRRTHRLRHDPRDRSFPTLVTRRPAIRREAGAGCSA